MVYISYSVFNRFKREFPIIIFIHYKPRIAVAISRLVVDEDDLKWVTNEEKMSLLLKQFHETMTIFVLIPLGVGN